jgi:hypothetical protein
MLNTLVNNPPVYKGFAWAMYDATVVKGPPSTLVNRDVVYKINMYPWVLSEPY